MRTGSDDPTVIQSIAVTASDVVDAYEATRQRGADAALRVTPPFDPRMRARIHVGAADYDEDPHPIHVPPADLLADDAIDAYPTPDDTASDLDDADGYDPDAHHDHHAERLAEWRTLARDAIVDTVTLALPDGDHAVAVKPLG
jgi:hypothetical protein